MNLSSFYYCQLLLFFSIRSQLKATFFLIQIDPTTNALFKKNQILQKQLNQSQNEIILLNKEIKSKDKMIQNYKCTLILKNDVINRMDKQKHRKMTKKSYTHKVSQYNHQAQLTQEK